MAQLPPNPTRRIFWLFLLILNFWTLFINITIGNMGLSALAICMILLSGFELTRKETT